MKYFKDTGGNVYAYESDGSQDAYIKPDLVPMTYEEVAAHLNPPQPEQIQSEIVVTPWQIRQAMNELGLRSQIETLVHNTTNQDIKDGWEYATEWREHNTFVRLLGQQLGLTESQIHAIFLLASEK